jgi:hypothetical protein
VLTQTQGCEPIIVNPNGFFYLRIQPGPLSHLS